MTISKEEWDRFMASIAGKPVNRSNAREDFLAQNIGMRRSRPSASGDSQASMAVFFDVTGSMSDIPLQFVNGTMLTLTREIANRGSIPYPEIMFGAIGDVEYDRYPLQATEFNTDIEAAHQLRQLCLEGGGGSNYSESYPAAWIFAARKTMPGSLKYGRKGILITMGDEEYPDGISGANLLTYLGIGNGAGEATQAASAVSSYTPSYASSSGRDRSKRDAGFITTEQMLEEVQAKYEVFHLFLKSDNYPATYKKWQGLLDDRVIPVKAADMDKVAEIIVSIIDRFYTGMRLEDVASSWQSTAIQAAVEHSIKDLGSLGISENANTDDLQEFRPVERTAVQFLTDHGFSDEESRIDSYVGEGHTPLTLAATNGSYATCYTLATKHKANINGQNRDGDTALHIALRNYYRSNQDFKNIVLWLVSAGANANLANKAGETALQLALDMGVDLGTVIEKNRQSYHQAFRM